MKNIVLLAMMAVCLSSFSATSQTKVQGKKPLTKEQQLVKEMKHLAEEFRHCVEQIGSNGSLTEKEKDRMRREEVPKLFYRYNDRYMITTRGNGAVTAKRKMKDFFYNLQKQARMNHLLNSGAVTTYVMSYVYISKDDAPDGLNWKLFKVHTDGTKEYHLEMPVSPEFVTMSEKGNKVITVFHPGPQTTVIRKVVTANEPGGLKLDDITATVRINESSR